jgi:membrane-bound metal-dependent hydrolase YbcI (DUF457 family)
MADFKTHITTSCVLGVGYGAAGYLYGNLPPTTCALATGMCGLAGMLPDLDSDSGVPVRETMSFVAALVPMLMIDRFQSMGLAHESIAVAGALTYLFVRFGIGGIFKRYTVHRGMWHSIPAAASAGLIAFLACSCEDLNARYYKSAAVVLGFMSHLVLDEIWAVSFRGVVPKFKKSFGTALKFWGDDRWANVSTYAKVLILSLLATGDPVFMNWMGYHHEGLPQFAQQWVDQLRAKSQDVVRQAEDVLRRPETHPHPHSLLDPQPQPQPQPPDRQPIDFDGWPLRR